jgi:hypothetical protein
MWVKYKLHLLHLEIALILMQDSCTERPIGSKIILGTPNGLQGDMGQVEARFSLLGDGVNLGVR